MISSIENADNQNFSAIDNYLEAKEKDQEYQKNSLKVELENKQISKDVLVKFDLLHVDLNKKNLNTNVVLTRFIELTNAIRRLPNSQEWIERFRKIVNYDHDGMEKIVFQLLIDAFECSDAFCQNLEKLIKNNLLFEVASWIENLKHYFEPAYDFDFYFRLFDGLEFDSRDITSRHIVHSILMPQETNNTIMLFNTNGNLHDFKKTPVDTTQKKILLKFLKHDPEAIKLDDFYSRLDGEICKRKLSTETKKLENQGYLYRPKGLRQGRGLTVKGRVLALSLKSASR